MESKKYSENRVKLKYEYYDKRLDLFQEYTAKLEKLKNKFIKSNAKYKKGDFIQGTNGLIICVDAINIYDGCDENLSFIYYGPAFTKRLEPRKIEPKKYEFYESEVIKKIK